MIPQNFIETIQARTDIVELISGYIPLKRTGRNFKAVCPFHNEKTPSFIVSPQKQIFHCFGCGQGGGVIQFLMFHEKVSFPEAVEILANRLGIEVPYQRSGQAKLKNLLYDAVNEASLFFHNNLLQDKNCKGVLDYLNKRGIDIKTIKKFRIGFAWGRNSLINLLRKKKFTLDILEKSSLIVAKQQGYRDLFCERITFPIFDTRSRVIGFGARLLQQSQGPKYINSLENPLYSKRKQLFGLNFSKEDIAKKDCAVAVEGYLDMITPFMAGVTNIVASSGTALTPEQIQLIRRYTSNIILVFDSDKAGQLATLRAIDLLLEGDLNVEISQLPKGYDPDSLVRAKGKDYFLGLLEKREDFFDYKVRILRGMHDIDTINGKEKIAKEVFSTIDRLSSEIKKYEYIKKLSHILNIKEEVLIADFRKTQSKGKAPSIKQNASFVMEPLSITEKIILKFMLTNKKAFFLVKKNLKEEDFTPGLSRRAVEYLLKNYSAEEDISYAQMIGSIEDKDISTFVSRILIDDQIPLDREMFKSSIMKLRKRRISALKEKVKDQIREAESTGDEDRRKKLINKYYKINSEVKNG